MADDLHLVDSRRRKHERALDTHSVGDATDLERAVEAIRPVQADHHPFEYLDPLFTALDDPDVDTNGVPNFDLGAALAATLQ